MAKPRQKASGMWEIALRHPSLPGGRKYFTFDTEAQAMAYGEQWSLLKMAGIQPPAELLKPATKKAIILAHLIRTWANSGLAAPTQHSSLGSLMTEVGAVNLEDATYTWLAGYLQQLKVKNNLAPNSIRHRIQALGRCIDEYLRHNPTVVFSNPVRLLPKGYSTYTEVDRVLVQAAGKSAKVDIARDRRLNPGEEERIVTALSGGIREDRERALLLKGGNALLTMFKMIVYSGMRLREAYLLRRGQVDLDLKVIQVQSTKQWRGKVVFRDIPMRPEVHRALLHYLSTRTMLPSAHLFPFIDEDDDLPLKKVTQRLSERFLSAFEYAGCQELHEHDLRHEATCRWLEMRDITGNWMFRLEEINRFMGWSPNSVMAQRYASFRGSDLSQRMWATQAPEVKAATGGATAV